MKKYINTLSSIALLLLLSAPTFAQRSGFGIHFGGYDFYGPQTGKYFRSEVYKRSYNVNKFGVENGGFDTTLTKNLKWTPLAKASMWWEVNDVIDNGVKEVYDDIYHHKSRIDGVLKKGDKL
jgi:hypothetical protein